MNQAEFDKAMAGTCMPDVSVLVAYEEGDLTDDQLIEMVQHGIDHDWIWQLQGHYGRLAANLIESGLCTRMAS